MENLREWLLRWRSDQYSGYMEYSHGGVRFEFGIPMAVQNAINNIVSVLTEPFKFNIGEEVQCSNGFKGTIVARSKRSPGMNCYCVHVDDDIGLLIFSENQIWRANV